jgi:DNA-binding ferritin-like protein
MFFDVGTGTGAVAQRAAAIVGPRGRILAIDPSPDMLALARNRIAACGLTNVTVREGRAESIAADDRSFDVVLSSLTLRQCSGAITTATRTDLSGDAVEEISSNLRRLLADVFALYVKTKNFHWHMSGQHFRDYHLLLDEQSTQIFAMTDEIAERARKIGGTTIRSITDIAKNQRLKDNNKEMVSPQEMIGELYADNQQ